ncbi:VWA domain-containing protein [Prosthecobacter sp.]|uniref:VWA domain-containing protein n=1 Tax=Prosthecobacter sp. TaxID=1965333 RepID=UPI001D3072B9|nr:VWA domain-containing protein [Prosthecobacter sp.]MCB1276508.1 VWA domain-containing protein [Prosthecobacter sp.]
MRLSQNLCVLILFAALPSPAADEGEALLKSIVKNVRSGNQEALAPLKELHTHKMAADTVLTLVGDKRVGIGIKMRLAEIVASWPSGEARRMLADWLNKHPSCDDETLFFFADIGLLETRGFFWSLITQLKGPLSDVRNPERVALAAKALGAFQDNPEVVVARIAAMLDPANAHVMRACAAEALGGMRSALAIQSLLPQLRDDSIGHTVRCSLYRLTGQDFVEDDTKWKTWLTEQGPNIPWKMLARSDFDNYLKLQKLLKPLDEDPTMNMASFYGVEFRAKGALFILDVSGSMDFENRISKLKGQMSDLLVAMQNTSSKLRYGIVTFGEDVESCFSGRGIAQDDEKNHKQAVRFVERIQANGGTPMCEALNLTLTKILPAGNIDAIYFLSDGSPSDGTPDQVLDLAKRIHETFQVRIHTIAIGEEPAQGFEQASLLQQIANACGGTFTIPR